MKKCEKDVKSPVKMMQLLITYHTSSISIHVDTIEKYSFLGYFVKRGVSAVSILTQPFIAL